MGDFEEMPTEIRGTDRESWAAAGVIEQIINAARSGPRGADAIMLLGRRQLHAIKSIKDISLAEMRNDVVFGRTFYGIPIMFVDEENYARVMVSRRKE